MGFIEQLTALLAPDDCLRCNREGALLCADCLPRLLTPPGWCFGCRRPLVAGAVACSGCRQAAGCTDMFAATTYAGIGKLLVATLKFRGNQSAAQIMADRLLQVYKLPSDAVLVHVPATAAHIRQRGFDQAELIARQLANHSGLLLLDALRRQGSTHQLGADRQTRQAQLTGTVRVRTSMAPRLAGMRVVLVDDVLTTGASLTTSALALRAAGAARVEAVVFAQAPPPGSK